MLDYSFEALLRGIATGGIWVGGHYRFAVRLVWLMLWYAGFWEEPQSALRKRHGA
jgi:hypothetical protein